MNEVDIRQEILLNLIVIPLSSLVLSNELRLVLGGYGTSDLISLSVKLQDMFGSTQICGMLLTDVYSAYSENKTSMKIGN